MTMTDIYLVIEVGFEGLKAIYRGFLDPDQAVDYYKTLVEEKEKEAAENAEDELDMKYMLDSIKRLCIRKGSETEDFRCICGELGIGPGELVLY